MSKAEKTVDTGEDIVKLPTFPYNNIYGALGIQTSKSQIDWERCRDRFQNKTESATIKSFLFFHRDGTGDNVVRFIKTFESACDCPQDMEIKFKKTNNKNVIHVEMSDWWRYKVRRSLLTALLRCGQNFTEDTGACFTKTLNSEYYTSSTKAALDAFLEGRTACKMQRHANFPGWYAFFNGKQKDQVERCLVKLKKKKKEGEEPVVQEGTAELPAPPAPEATAATPTEQPAN